MSELSTGQLRLISQELLNWLVSAYPPPQITAKMSENDIKWAAAQHEVVTNLIAKANAKQTLVNPANAQTAAGAYIRMGT